MQSKKAASILAGVLLVWLTLVVNVAYGKPNPKVEYNKVKDQTEVSIPIEWIKKNKFGYDAAFIYAGKVPSRPGQVFWRFVGVRPLSLGDRIQWDKADRIYFRYGDTKLNYPIAYDVRENNDTLTKGLFGRVFVETVTCAVPTDDFVPMSQAKEVLFQIGDTSSTLAGGNIELVAALGRLIPPAPVASTASPTPTAPPAPSEKNPDSKKGEPTK
jgi:hypothetical protein